MTSDMWVLVISRVVICLCAGEIAIRYLGWSWLILRQKERFAAAPIVFGIALWALSRFAVEFRWITVMGTIKVGQVASLVDGDGISEISRIGIIIALCFLTYPVQKIVYKHSWEKALVEMTVRSFLITVSLIAGYMICLVRLHYTGM